MCVSRAAAQRAATLADLAGRLAQAYPMILAYKVEAKPGTFGTFSRADFRRAFEPTK